MNIVFMFISVLDYELRDLEIPTITVVGKLVKAGIPVLVYRYAHASCFSNNVVNVNMFGLTYLNLSTDTTTCYVLQW